MCIRKSRWSTASSRNTSPFTELTIIHSTAQTIGAAMRDLDDRAILANDFIIVYGDVVSNLPLESALAAHKARRAADKSAIMTMMLREADMNHRTNVHGYTPVFVLDPKKGRCLHYEQMVPGEDNHRVTLSYEEILKTHQEVDIRTDLIDCGIDILTPDALALWKDYFDLEAPRRQWLYKILGDFELNAKTIHTHIITDHYAARVRNLHAYDSVSRDIVSRWSYPLCPDSNLLRGHSYRLQKGMIYQEQGVILARSCIINKRTVIGERTSVGEGTVIGNSVIGRNCVIGKNVTIEGAYLWDNVTVGDGSVIKKAILADEAVVGKKSTVEPGALLSYAIRISDNTTVPGTRRITSVKRKRTTITEGGIEQTQTTTETGASDPSVVGANGEGFDLAPSSEEDPEEEEYEQLANVGLIYTNPAFSLSHDSISTLNSDAESDYTDSTTRTPRSATSSFSIGGGDDALFAPQGPQQGHKFHAEAVDSIYDLIASGQDANNVQIELQSLRMSTNATEHQVRRAVVQGFMKRITQLYEADGKLQAAVSSVLGPYQGMLERAVDDVSESAKVDNQKDLLLLFQSDAVTRKDGDSLLLFLVKDMVDKDVVEVEAVEAWWSDPKGTEKEDMRAVREKTKQLVEFLLEDSEEEDEDEDESDDE
jgi:NDP-sugar pyrophosphorylase family protein